MRNVCFLFPCLLPHLSHWESGGSTVSQVWDDLVKQEPQISNLLPGNRTAILVLETFPIPHFHPHPRRSGHKGHLWHEKIKYSFICYLHKTFHIKNFARQGEKSFSNYAPLFRAQKREIPNYFMLYLIMAKSLVSLHAWHSVKCSFHTHYCISLALLFPLRQLGKWGINRFTLSEALSVPKCSQWGSDRARTWTHIDGPEP